MFLVVNIKTATSEAPVERKEGAFLKANDGRMLLGDRDVPSRLSWPQRTVYDIAWWAGIFGTLFGVLTPFYSAFTALLIAVLATPLIFAAIFLIKGGRVAYMRIRDYPFLYQLTEDRTTALQEARNTVLSLSDELFGERTLEIEVVQYYNEKLHLRLKRSERLNLSVGSEIKIIDLSDGALMGTFEILQLLPNQYVARNTANVNALWLGYILEKGGVESLPPPNVVAVSIARGQSQS